MSLSDRLKKAVKSWKKRPEILLCPGVPRPLHEVAPRTVLGAKWWEKTRQEAYASTNYHCQACGIHKSEAKYYRHLEGHELYEIDFLLGRMTYIETVPLCHACHSFIHLGRLEALVEKGEVDKKILKEVLEHGKQILVSASLRRAELPGLLAAWQDWRLVIGDKEYPPKYKTSKEWEKHFGGIE